VSNTSALTAVYWAGSAVVGIKLGTISSEEVDVEGDDDDDDDDDTADTIDDDAADNDDDKGGLAEESKVESVVL
jgi:hypothetical protein